MAFASSSSSSGQTINSSSYSSTPRGTSIECSSVFAENISSPLGRSNSSSFEGFPATTISPGSTVESYSTTADIDGNDRQMQSICGTREINGNDKQIQSISETPEIDGNNRQIQSISKTSEIDGNDGLIQSISETSEIDGNDRQIQSISETPEIDEDRCKSHERLRLEESTAATKSKSHVSSFGSPCTKLEASTPTIFGAPNTSGISFNSAPTESANAQPFAPLSGSTGFTFPTTLVFGTKLTPPLWSTPASVVPSTSSSSAASTTTTGNGSASGVQSSSALGQKIESSSAAHPFSGTSSGFGTPIEPAFGFGTPIGRSSGFGGTPIAPSSGFGGTRIAPSSGFGSTPIAPPSDLSATPIAPSSGFGGTRIAPSSGFGGIPIAPSSDLSATPIAPSSGFGGTQVAPSSGFGGTLIAPSSGFGSTSTLSGVPSTSIFGGSTSASSSFSPFGSTSASKSPKKRKKKTPSSKNTSAFGALSSSSGVLSSSCFKTGNNQATLLESTWNSLFPPAPQLFATNSSTQLFSSSNLFSSQSSPSPLWSTPASSSFTPFGSTSASENTSAFGVQNSSSAWFKNSPFGNIFRVPPLSNQSTLNSPFHPKPLSNTTASVLFQKPGQTTNSLSQPSQASNGSTMFKEVSKQGIIEGQQQQSANPFDIQYEIDGPNTVITIQHGTSSIQISGEISSVTVRPVSSRHNSESKEKDSPKGQTKTSNGTSTKPENDSKQNSEFDINVGLSDCPMWFCSLCNSKATSKQALLHHANGKKHRAKARAFHESKQQPNGAAENDTTSEIPANNDGPEVGNNALASNKKRKANNASASNKKRKAEASDKDGAHHLTGEGKASPSASFKINVNETEVSDDTSLQDEDDDEVLKKCKADVLALIPKLPNGGDYYTEPCIKDLAAKETSKPGFCSRVKDFVVGRKGYGSIKFLGETDIRNLDIESVIHFNNREVIVYPDSTKKPPAGQSLNKPAEVTLLNVKCIIKNTGEEYVDGVEVQSYKAMLVKKASENGAEFVSYDPVLGEWKFRVQHF
ncbi:hypothetical protein ABFS82_02G083900 [Erythranthe guttata]